MPRDEYHDAELGHPVQERVDLPRYLPITISATCANCGAETDNAERDMYETWHYITIFCPECFERVHELTRSGPIGVALSGIVGQRVKCKDENGYCLIGTLIALTSGQLCVWQGNDILHCRLVFSPDLVAEVNVASRSCVPYGHKILFWNGDGYLNSTTYHHD